MEIKKNDKFTVPIEDMGEDGAGIGRVDGYIWFVKDADRGYDRRQPMKMKKITALPDLCVSSPRQKAAWRRNVRWRELRRMPASGTGL